MAAAKSSPRKKSTARKVATSAAKGAAKGAAKSAARGATAASTKAVAAGSQRIGRGTRWTEEQVKLLLDTVSSSGTAKEAFEVVARELGKSAGTVAQKYYNLQKGSGAAPRRRGRPAGSGAGASARATGGTGGGLPTPAQLRGLTVDDLVGLAARVKTEIDRRRDELDAAAEALKG
jgi:hypothetical protein